MAIPAKSLEKRRVHHLRMEKPVARGAERVQEINDVVGVRLRSAAEPHMKRGMPASSKVGVWTDAFQEGGGADVSVLRRHQAAVSGPKKRDRAERGDGRPSQEDP